MNLYQSELKTILGLLEYLNHHFHPSTNEVALGDVQIIDSNGEVVGTIIFDDFSYAFKPRR